MTTERPDQTPYRVLIPVSDTETNARAQARFVASLPNAPACVEATLTHILHGEELSLPYNIRTAQRVGTVVHARDYLRDNGVAVRIMDADHPYPPAKGIVSLADRIDADLLVLGGGIHGSLDDLLTGQVTKSVSKRTSRPITIVSEASTDTSSES